MNCNVNLVTQVIVRIVRSFVIPLDRAFNFFFLNDLPNSFIHTNTSLFLLKKKSRTEVDNFWIRTSAKREDLLN